MPYKIDNAILKKDKTGRVTLIDPENVFKDEDAFVAIKSDDLITIQLLINSILHNDFKRWSELGVVPETEPVKSLFVRLGYSKADIASLLKRILNILLMEVFKMPEFKLSKEAGTKKFELSIAIDYDEDGNIEAQEFYDGVDWSDNPADIRLNTSYCDEDEQDEWNLFFNDFMHLLESNELTEKAETLKESR